MANRASSQLLARITDPVIGSLVGDQGVLAVTNKELFYITQNGTRRLMLADIQDFKLKPGELVFYRAGGGRLMGVRDELPEQDVQLFLRGLKRHIAKSKQPIHQPSVESGSAQEEGEGKKLGKRKQSVSTIMPLSRYAPIGQRGRPWGWTA